jgi:glycosyltransferase involved in cell wall biosynthesis
VKILLLEPHPILPANRGNKHHTLGLLRYLAPRHDVHVLCFKEAGVEEGWAALEKELPVRVLETYPPLRGRALRMRQLRLGLQGHPWSLAHWWSEPLRARLAAVWPGEYDVVVADMYQMAPYALLCRDAPRVLIGSDSYSLTMLRAARTVSSLQHRVKLLASAALLLRFEHSLYPQFDAVACVSDVDNRWLTRVNGRIQTRRVEVPIDGGLLERPRRVCEQVGKHVIVWANIYDDGVARGVARFVELGWPCVTRVVPDAELLVWGRRPDARLARVIGRTPGVKHVDFVRDWVETLSRADVFLNPQRCGAGQPTRVQGAMALGVPVVLSPETTGGLDLRVGVEGYICRDPEEFAYVVSTLLKDPALRTRVGIAAREAMRTRFSVDVLGRKFERVLVEAVERHNGTRVQKRRAVGT